MTESASEKSMPPVPPTGSTEAKTLVQPKHIYLGVAVLVVAVAILVVLVILAIRNPVHTETFRDLAIIALAAESGLIGLALLVLIVQVARLTNMLEFEIKPILQNTTETVNTLRGTATFMSERMVVPVIKASGYASGITRLAASIRGLFVIGQTKKKSRSVDQPSKMEERNER